MSRPPDPENTCPDDKRGENRRTGEAYGSGLQPPVRRSLYILLSQRPGGKNDGAGGELLNRGGAGSGMGVLPVLAGGKDG